MATTPHALKHLLLAPSCLETRYSSAHCTARSRCLPESNSPDVATVVEDCPAGSSDGGVERAPEGHRAEGAGEEGLEGQGRQAQQVATSTASTQMQEKHINTAPKSTPQAKRT